MNEVEAWCVKKPNGQYHFQTMQTVSAEHCSDMFALWMGGKWDRLESEGNEVVKVSIKEIEDE